MLRHHKLKVEGLSIGQKMAIVLLIVAFIAVLLTTAIFYQRSQSTLHHLVNEHLLSVSSQQYEQVLQSIERSKDQLALITSRTQLRLSFKQWLNDKELGNSENPVHRTKMLKILADAKESVSNIVDLIVIDVRGNVVESTNVSNLSQQEEKLLTAVVSKGAIFNAFTLTKAENKHHLVFTQPLVLEGEMLGYLLLESDLSSYNNVLLNHKGLGETEEAYLVYRSKNNTAIPLTQLKFMHTNVDKTNINPFFVADKNTSLINNFIDYRGVDVFAVTRVIPILDWGLVFKIDREDAMKEINDQRDFIIIALLISSVVVLVFAIILGRSLTRSVIDMVEVATVIAQGDLSKRIDKLSNDELGLLAMAINKMADKLIDANLHLEKRIDDKTSELTITNKKLEKLSEELQKRALQDGLTQIANRRAFDEAMASEWKRGQRNGATLSLIMLDVDHFKNYNDTLGHPAGDKCLYNIAQLLKSFGQREGDVVARYGGEEFVVLLPNTNQQDCALIAERIRTVIFAAKYSHPDSPINEFVTVSIGAGTIIPSDMSSSTLFIQAVDVALYHAKNKGRNRVELAKFS
ncbi:diguanylate cyclase [Thalassotalea fusca]